MLHFWLIPILILMVVIVSILYLVVRTTGGSGVRTEGRTVHDQTVEDDNPPPS